jgi:hypothetical protein
MFCHRLGHHQSSNHHQSILLWNQILQSSWQSSIIVNTWIIHLKIFFVVDVSRIFKCALSLCLEIVFEIQLFFGSFFWFFKKNIFGWSSLGLVECLRCPGPEVFVGADLETEIRVAEAAEKNEGDFRILTNESDPRRLLLLKGNELQWKRKKSFYGFNNILPTTTSTLYNFLDWALNTYAKSFWPRFLPHSWSRFLKFPVLLSWIEL